MERREAAAWPEPPRSLAELASWPQRFGNFFSDHFGFRSEMIRLRGWIGVQLQHKSVSPEVILGSSGWMFYAGDGSIENHLHRLPLSESELNAWSARLQKRRAWLGDRGIAYLFVVAPDKQSIYPEYTPTALSAPPGETRLDQLTRRFGADRSWLDLREALLAAKRDGRLYFRADTHWNDRGAYQGYRAIMARLGLPALARDEAGLPRVTHPDDLAQLSGLPQTEPDTSFAPTCGVADQPARDKAAREPGGSGFHSRAPSNCDKGHGRLLIFQDSFGEPMAPYLSESFARVVYVWHQPSFTEIQEMVAVERPTVVIEERVERYLIRPPPP